MSDVGASGRRWVIWRLVGSMGDVGSGGEYG